MGLGHVFHNEGRKKHKDGRGFKRRATGDTSKDEEEMKHAGRAGYRC